MFILRKLTQDAKAEMNFILGESYTYITKFDNPTEFERTKEVWGDKECTETYAFITYSDGTKVMPLYRKQWNYIMTSNGKTFENLTYHR